MIKQILLVLLLTLLIPSASALGIERVEFFEVEQGSTQSIVIDVYTSPTELENEFTYEIISDDKDIHDWMTVSPTQFIMAPGEQRQPITVTLTIPITAELGDRNGELKYAGSRVSGGGTIGYTVATKSVIHFKIVKEGAKKKIDFITMDANPYIRPNEIAKFSATVKNTGNIPCNFHTSLVIEEDYEEVFKVDSAPMNMGVGLFEDITLYWEPEEKGNYTGHFKIIFDDSVDDIIGTTLKSDSFLVIVSDQAPIVSNQDSLEAFKNPSTLIGIICIIGAIVVIVLTFRPGKKEGNNRDETTGKDD